MRIMIVCVLIALVLKVESLTFCDNPKCLCINKLQSVEISCSSHPSVLEADNYLPDNVTDLDLSQNNLIHIQRPFISSRLTKLLLNNNKIIEIANDSFRLPSLKILDLSHNNLKFLHRNIFAQIQNLEYLNLASNKFSAFGNVNLYHLNILQEIIFDDNKIGPSLDNHSLFKGGYDLTNTIQTISLRNAHLNSKNKDIFIIIMAAKDLKKLDLAENNITEIINLPPNLQYLDLSSNPIKNLSHNIFLDTIYLSVLKLNNIQIYEVRDFTFFYLCSLRQLELQDNRHLKKFSPLAWGRIIQHDQIDLFVEYLSLRRSNFTSLDKQLEGIFKKIKNVDLRDNSWNCDCNIDWLQNVGIPEDYMDFRCSTPKNLYNRRILEINITEFVCEEPAPSSSIGIVLYCTLLALALLLMYFFIFSPKPYIYRQLPIEFPRTP